MVKSSIIIINYNTAGYTLQAITSVIAHHLKSNYEIIVVDNASQKEDYTVLKKEITELKNPRIKLIRSRINTGFGAGNMMGVQIANGQYYVFLNSDAHLQEDSISVMVDFLENNSKASIVGAMPLDENGKPYKSFDYNLSLRKELFGDKILHLLNPKQYPSRKKVFKEPTKVGAVPGSFFICRASDFDIVGGFDTNMFLYYEEKDLSYRIKKKLGKEVYSLPQTAYTHLKGKSTPSSYEIKQELKISQFYCVRKNLGPLKYFIFFTFNSLKFLIKAPFSNKNKKYLLLLFSGGTLGKSLKHKQPITPFFR